MRCRVGTLRRDGFHHITGRRAATAPNGLTAYNVAMPCEIYHIPYKATFRWKWRQLAEDGTVKVESQESYELFYDCVCDARKHGYQPRISAPKGSMRIACA